ncbi:TPA: Asp23/Gls24 family envelope stress response protein [Streptococcus suis]|uniref:Stress response regulator gls24 homolog n=1 Tax=Streptococcus suis TaxID=1307 RepID=A0A9X4MUV0_STRSU|nr:Asp23/Gls24 family envelope stress response protein [Streptococcus suis]HEM3598900.1 Asp23/Gls24 family envelope stress response protein [Streptococcus suis]HEM3608892.1 Asp23/Gls24 family envelope stress response protein [Streptococcus suis]HEM3616891.1 Asp23/Gls24 family envelope stress response protein [Streptococcus suis]HEM3620939.1 Asp23/Gls24 family envelope stress response protein [Streptococcus suis]
MAKITEVEQTSIKGTVTYADQVIEKMVGHALQHVPGLLSISGGFFTDIKNKLINSSDVREGINVEVGSKQVATDLKIVVEYGKDIPEIVETMKSIIGTEVKKMTHLEVVEVNVEVVDIKTREEFEAESVTLQDRVASATQATGEVIGNQASKAGDFVTTQTEVVKDKLESSRVQ